MNKFFLTGAILLLIASGGLAQNMGAVNATLNQQQFLQQQHWHMQFQLNQMAGMRRASSTGLVNRKSNYRVLMNSGIAVTVLSRMEFDEAGRAYLVLEDKSKKKDDSLRTTRILPSQTQSVSQLTGAYQEIIQGSPADSCWLFKVVPGAVNAYSFLPETYALHIGYLKMLQKGDGELLPFTEANLKDMLADDQQALALMDKKLYYEALLLYNKNSRKKARQK